MRKPTNVAALALIAVSLGGLVAMAQQAAKPPAAANAFDVAPIQTEVLGQTRWIRGGPAALRVIVSDHRTGKPVRAQVSLDLKPAQPGGSAQSLFTGETNSVGTLEARFRAPSAEPGAYDLTVGVTSPIGKDSVIQRIEIQRSEQILLTCDKPLYQPGQLVHLRALVLDLADRHAVSSRPITFEIEDARGNKVFKRAEALSKFGVAAVDFQLADEVNMGTFTIRALVGDANAEKKVRVERYVLPKFKVAVKTERPYYLPGETVNATIQADYFFGKPVAGGDVALTINTVDIGVSKLAEIQGKTDPTGLFKFEYTLPQSFVGQPFEQGKAVVEFQARITDTADHQQMQSLQVPVVKEPILIVMVPESAQPAPGIQNRLYIACGTPDGAPVKGADLAVTTTQDGSPLHLTTDSMGLATFSFVPRPGNLKVTVQATEANGHSATAARDFAIGASADAVLLRSDKSLARVGDRLELTVLSSARGGTIYLDVIRNRQTIITRAEPAGAGKAQFSLPVTNDMVGTIQVHAYKILPDENIIRDTRTVVVSPADDLDISVTPDRREYQPGADALLRFAVRSKSNQPVAAAIGLAIVDESVFALSELQPGLEKIVFMLERELMEPKYEIHGLRPREIILQPRSTGMVEDQRQRAGAMLLAAAPQGAGFDYRTNTFQKRWDAMREKVQAELSQAQARIRTAAQRYRQAGGELQAEDALQALVDKGYLRRKEILDPWGHAYRPLVYGSKSLPEWFGLSSAGPDGKFGTADDVTTEQRWRGRGFGGGLGAFGGRMGGGGAVDRMMVEDAAMPMAMAKADLSLAYRDAAKPAAPGASGAPEPRVRQYFPETMLWAPSIITDDQGRAELKVPIADSITTWRMSMLANSAAGQLGSATAPLKVFQDFFVDIDLPVALTQNDRVEIPIAVYNYLPGAQSVTLTMEKQPWFALEGDAVQVIKMGKNEVKSVSYPITVKELGRHTLKIVARGTKLSDAIQRSIDVTPDGKEIRAAINDRLEKTVEKSVAFPANAVPGANSIWVKLYPGTFSQVVEGLDGLLRMPNGCFEQTSSTTYPNILVTDYLKTNKKANPELLMKAEGYINVGYQRLVTFECKSGGFSWFGDEPANQVLTAYGLLEFSDMKKVHDVDPALITRVQGWLAGRQKQDGTWPEDKGGIAEGIINRQTGAVRTSAYIAWALAESGYAGPELARAVTYVKEHRGEAKDAYTLALILNLLTKVEKNGETAAAVAGELVALAKQTDKAAWWEGDTQTFTGAKKESADLETTGLAAYGLAKWGRNSGFTTKVLTYLVQSKDSFGTWSTTQGTVWAMKALLFASSNASGGGKGTVTVYANGTRAATFAITPADADVMRQVDLREWLKPDKNDIKLTYDGEGSLLYQIASRHYLPWSAVGQGPKGEGPLSISVEYDKTTLAKDDTAQVKVVIKNNTDKTAEMPLIDLGVPPGFTVMPEELDAAVKAKTISKYTLAARQVIIYMEKLDPSQSVELHYAVKARFPIKARTPVSKAYPYYNPEQATSSAPQSITVTR